jgi:hypothetical protein
VSVSFDTNGVSSTGTTSITPVLPTGTAAGKMLLCFVGSNHATDDSATPATPSGWTQLFTFVGTGGGSQGVGTGNRRLTVFYREAASTRVVDGGTEANPTVTLTGGNVMAGNAICLSKTGSVWNFTYATGEDSTSDTALSITCSSSLSVYNGDFLMEATVASSTASMSAEAVAITGATIATVTERTDAAGSSGNTLRVQYGTTSVTFGSGTATPILTGTHASATIASGAVIRVIDYHNVLLGSASEAETAQAVGRAKRKAVTASTETDSAVSFGRRKRTTALAVNETDESRGIFFSQGQQLNQVTDTSTALPIGKRKRKGLGTATQADVATTVRPARRIATSPALETETARPLLLVIPTYRFEPPTYARQWEPPPLVKRPMVQLTESISVVRVGGSLRQIKSPSHEQLQAAGAEGRDYFLGGHVYVVSHSIAQELQAAGFTVTAD